MFTINSSIIFPETGPWVLTILIKLVIKAVSRLSWQTVEAGGTYLNHLLPRSIQNDPETFKICKTPNQAWRLGKETTQMPKTSKNFFEILCNWDQTKEGHPGPSPQLQKRGMAPDTGCRTHLAPGALQMPNRPGWHAVANIPSRNMCLAALLAFLTPNGPEIFIVSMELAPAGPLCCWWQQPSWVMPVTPDQRPALSWDPSIGSSSPPGLAEPRQVWSLV